MKIWRYFFLFGLLTTLIGLTVNLSQQKDYQCVAIKNQPSSNIVSDNDGNLFQLPFRYRLEEIISENYPSGRAKSHTAKVICHYQNVTDTLEISENRPAKFYQYDLSLLAVGKAMGNNDYAEFRITQSYAEVIVYIGFILLILSSLGWLIHQFPKKKAVGVWILVVALLIIITVIVLVVNPMLQSREIPPILRSHWFIPHVVSYLLSYALLAAGFLTAVHAWWNQSAKVLDWSKQLMKCGTGFYTIGLALGILWAKSAWGTFWNWDPKETLALITYGYYLEICVASRYVTYLKRDPKLGTMGNNTYSWNLAMQSFGILFLLVCWFGPMFLPYLLEASPSLHSY